MLGFGILLPRHLKSLVTLTLGAFSDWAFLVCHLGQQPSCLSILFILYRWMRLANLSAKPYPSVISGFVAYLIKDNVLTICVVRRLVYSAK